MMRRAMWPVTVVAAVAVTACGTQPSPPPADAAPTSAPVPHETDMPPGFDVQPDTPVVPDEELTPDQLAALLRVPATAAPASDSCAPSQVAIELAGYDAALGHRYSSIRVTNRSEASCSVRGWPGIGARGEWGNNLLLVAEQSTIDVSGAPERVTIAPGASAVASLEWTGELAGAQTEQVSMLVVQLAQGQDVAAVTPEIDTSTAADGDSPSGDVRLDIGMGTTVRLGPFVAVS